MKVILSVSVAVIIYIGSFLGFPGQVDYTGTYYPRSDHETSAYALVLYKDGLFEYQIENTELIYSTNLIKGKYVVRGNQVRFLPTVFERNLNHTYTFQSKEQQKIKTSGVSINVIDAQKAPELFKRILAEFESGTTGLSPSYYLKKTNKRLSLCHLDLKTEQYQVKFLKQKKNDY